MSNETETEQDRQAKERDAEYAKWRMQTRRAHFAGWALAVVGATGDAETAGRAWALADAMEAEFQKRFAEPSP